jgi:ribosomal protein S18 acetylase RimI-like enzyme
VKNSREIVVVHDIEPSRFPQLLELFADEWWTTSREAGAVEQMLAHSGVVVGLVDASSDRLVGFARAITDHTFLAVVLDVIVDPAYRGNGLGTRLIEEVLARPELASVDSIELVCQPELVAFYERRGFTDRIGRSLLMRRTDNPLLRNHKG